MFQRASKMTLRILCTNIVTLFYPLRLAPTFKWYVHFSEPPGSTLECHILFEWLIRPLAPHTHWPLTLSEWYHFSLSLKMQPTNNCFFFSFWMICFFWFCDWRKRVGNAGPLKKELRWQREMIKPDLVRVIKENTTYVNYGCIWSLNRKSLKTRCWCFFLLPDFI